ncbi:ABC transporter substrate-binding protein [Paenibacillus sp. TRM 82003]|nr:ABC transporter substrate-binding protein [Paenibacillus sp. TRM 82003]
MKTAICIGLIGVIALTGCGSRESTADQPKETVKMASWSQPISEQTNVLAEEKHGWFAANGIDFEFVPGAGGGDAIKNIVSGQADIAFTDPSSFFFALDKGEKLIAIYNIYPQNVFNVVSKKESGIESPEQLKGKTIGVYSLASGTRHNLLLLLSTVGLTESDVTIVETGLLNFAPLIQGQVDATAATDTGLLAGREKGLGEDVNVMEVKDYLNVPSDLFVVTEETYRTKKDVLRKFLEAYRDSAAWMIEHPEEAAKHAVEAAIDGQDEARNLGVIELRNASSVSSATEANGLGALEPDVLQHAADTYYELGLISQPLQLDEFVKSDLLPGAE